MIRRSPHRSRAVIAIPLAVAAFAVFVPVWSRPAEAQTAPPPVVGFTAPPVVPPSVTVTLPTAGVAVGTGTAVAGATATSGAVGAGATCGVVTGGTCLVVGGLAAAALFGSYAATTKALHTLFPRENLLPSTALTSAVIQSDWHMCADGGAMAQAIEDMHPGSACAAFSVGGIATSHSVWQFAINPNASRIALEGGLVNCGATGVSGCTVGVALADLLKATVISDEAGISPATVVLYRDPESLEACGGTYAACRILATDTLQILTRPGLMATPVELRHEVPLDRRIAVHGQQRRYVVNLQCERFDSEVTQTVSEYSDWWWDSEHEEGDWPVIIPACPGEEWLRKKLTVELETLGDATTKVLVEIDLSEAMEELKLLPETCHQSGTCIHTIDEDGNCRINGVIVDDGWCTRMQELQEVEESTGTRVGVSPAPQPNPYPRPPSPAPAPEPPAANPEAPANPPLITPDPLNPDADSDSCWPNGWGLLNPVDWVLKPVKCALTWAFIPETGLATRMDAAREAVSGTIVGSSLSNGAIIQAAVMGEGAPTSGCLGPSWSITWQGTTYGPYHPFAACDEPMATVADLFRMLVTTGVAVFVFVNVYNRVVTPVGIEPMHSRGDHDRWKS